MKYLEAQQLAGAVLGFSEAETENILSIDGDFEPLLFDRFNVDFEGFMGLAEALLKLTPVIASPLSGGWNHAFLRKVDGGYLAVVKKPVEQPEK